MKKNEIKILRLKLLNDITAAKKALRGLEKAEKKQVRKIKGDKNDRDKIQMQ